MQARIVLGAIAFVSTLAVVSSGNLQAQSGGSSILSGKYTVCDEGDHDVHAEYSGRHLKLGDTVTVGVTDLVVNVQLGQQVLDMVRVADGEQLVATYDFAHATADGTTVNVKHLVRVRRDLNYQPPAGGCTSSAPLIIEFCPRMPNPVNGSHWVCSPENAHYGHVHSEPYG